MTQAEFAEKLDLTQAALSGMEVGRNTITTESLLKMYQKFNVNPNYLLLGNEDMFFDKKKFEYKVNEIVDNEYEEIGTKDYIPQIIQAASKLSVERQLIYAPVMMLEVKC
jgi:transcriptional regulator with XRE-family HTH domain